MERYFGDINHDFGVRNPHFWVLDHDFWGPKGNFGVMDHDFEVRTLIRGTKIRFGDPGPRFLGPKGDFGVSDRGFGDMELNFGVRKGI